MARSLALGSNGAIYVVGTSLDSLQSRTLNIETTKVASVDGSQKWVRQADPSIGKDDEGVASTVDTLGNLIVLGWSRTDTRLGMRTSMVGYSPTGQVLFDDRDLGRTPSAYEEPVDIVAGPGGSVYVLGAKTTPKLATRGMLIRYSSE